MSSDNLSEWVSVVRDHQDDLIRTFNVSDGQLIVGRVESWIAPCTKGGGGAISSPKAKDLVGDVPVYMCSPYPGSNISRIRTALYDAQESGSGNYTLFDSVQSGSSALPAAVLPSHMGAWWWLPLLASMALTVVM